MYSFGSFSHMIMDRVRVRAYRDAMKSAIKPGDFVIDLGCGTGAFSFYAARLGARKVLGIEINPLVRLAKRQADLLGLDGVIEFYEGSSLELALSERADVVVCDLRGSLPFLGDGLSVVADAKARLLKESGTLIPMRDIVKVQPFGARRWYEHFVCSPWLDNELDLRMPYLHLMGVNDFRSVPRSVDCSLRALEFCTIEYSGIPELEYSKSLSWDIPEASVLHGVRLWFDAQLSTEVSFSGNPDGEGPEVYGSMALPFESPIETDAGDSLTVELDVRKVAGDFIYSWNTTLRSRMGAAKAAFRQSQARIAVAQQTRG